MINDKFEIEGHWKKGFILIHCNVKFKDYSPFLSLELITPNDNSYKFKIPLTRRGIANFVIKLDENVRKVNIKMSENFEITEVKISNISILEAYFRILKFTIPYVISKSNLNLKTRIIAGIDATQFIKNPYETYKRLKRAIIIRNSGIFDFYSYNRILRQKIIDSKLTNSFAAIVLSDNEDIANKTISNLKKNGINQIIICEPNKSNIDLNKIKTDYVFIFFPGDMLFDFSLSFLDKFIQENNNPDIFYCDHIDLNENPYFKPDWSYYYLIHYDYIFNAVIIKTDFLRKVGGFRSALGRYTSYELILRSFFEFNTIPKHLPLPLFILNDSKTNDDWLQGLLILKKYLNGNIEKNQIPQTFIFKPQLMSQSRVAIIIPTKDKSSLLRKCVSSILEKTKYNNFLIYLIENNSKEIETFELYEELSKNEKIKILKNDIEYNFSKLINFGMKNTEEEFVILLNNDTEIISEDWLDWIIRYLQLKDIGVVGARLLYPNGKIQHAGVIVGLYGLADHAFKGVENSDFGYMGRIGLVQEYLAVTAACMGFRREVYELVRGFDEVLAINFNDLDFCLKVYEKGYKIIYLPQATLFHHEHATRGKDDKPEKIIRANFEKKIIQYRWNKYIEYDPYYNINLNPYRNDFSFYCPGNY